MDKRNKQDATLWEHPVPSALYCNLCDSIMLDKYDQTKIAVMECICPVCIMLDIDCSECPMYHDCLRGGCAA